MSYPICFCEVRKALNTNNWKRIDSKMRFNRKFGSYSTFPCSCGKCKLPTKKESKIINKHFW